MSSPSRSIPWQTNLTEEDAKIGRALTGGHLQSVAKAVVSHKYLSELVFALFINKVDSECNTLCQRSTAPPSLFRKIPVSQLSDFNWQMFIDELSSSAPQLLQILTKIACHSDHRNKKKVNMAHYPSICMAAAVILKERNREMCGIQSLLSLLLFASCVQKQVNTSIKISC